MVNSTPFAARSLRLSNSLEKAFGETFSFEPFMKADDVNGRRTPDPSRAAFVSRGIFEAPSQSQTPTARGAMQDDLAHAVAASFPSVLVNDANLTWLPRPGDKVTRDFDGNFYEVSRTYPNGFGSTVVQLTAKKRWVVAPTPPGLRFNVAANSGYIPLI